MFKVNFTFKIRNCIKTTGNPDEHIIVETTQNICYKNWALCNTISPLIYNSIVNTSNDKLK